VPRPEIIAHRGASRERPENTLPAFERAADLGADGCEFDVHLHPDGVLRVHHDPLPSGGAGAPTLEEVLALHKARGLTAYAELKGPGTAPGTLAALAASGVTGAVHAFDHRQIALAQSLAPDIPRGVLEVSYPVRPLEALQVVGGRDLWKQWPYIDADLVFAADAAGCRIVAWTVNDGKMMEFLAAIGVHALCTDDVALARRVLGL
jgi:glycerophosphoryl diester phosphodiesterase